MRTILLKTINLENGQIFAVISGSRRKLSDCNVKVELYEQQRDIPAFGRNLVKSYKVSIVICDDIETTNLDYNCISRFEICGDILRKDDIYENIRMDNLAVNEIVEHGQWIFELLEYEQIKRLFELAS